MASIVMTPDLAAEMAAWASMASSRTYVLAGEPVVGQMQVDLGRRDRAVTGLGLQRFERHAGLAEPGEAGVAQLVTGRRGSSPARLRAPVMISSRPLAVSGRPRLGPFNTTNTTGPSSRRPVVRVSR